MIDSIILLGQKLSAYDVSATVYYSYVTDLIDGNSPKPLYQIYLKDIQETDSDILKYIGLRLVYTGSASNDKYSVSAFSEKYNKDKELRTLLNEWSEESNQAGYMQGPITQMSSELEYFEAGLGNNMMRITIDFNTLFLETR